MKSESTAVVEAPDRAVVLGLDRLDASPIVLEGTALAVWREIDGMSDTTEIIARLSRDFDVDANEIRSPIEEFLGRLALERLVSRTSGEVVLPERPTE